MPAGLPAKLLIPYLVQARTAHPPLRQELRLCLAVVLIVLSATGPSFASAPRQGQPIAFLLLESPYLPADHSAQVTAYIFSGPSPSPASLLIILYLKLVERTGPG